MRLVYDHYPSFIGTDDLLDDLLNRHEPDPAEPDQLIEQEDPLRHEPE
jgi:hypothetical protein